MEYTRNRTPAVVLVLAVLLCLGGPSVITFTDWEWRGLIGGGLSLLGTIVLLVGAILAAKDQNRVRDAERRAQRQAGESASL